MICFTDLDNTLIYSKRKNIGVDKVCIEYKNGDELSYMDCNIQSRLISLIKKSNVILCPVTTRSIKQFKRINFDFGHVALVANGAILLKDGVVDSDWYSESLYYAHECFDLFFDIKMALTCKRDITSKVNFVDSGLYMYFISSFPVEVMAYLGGFIDTDLVNMYNEGRKIYIIPKKLSKGFAIKRYLDRFGMDYVISAGDTLMDYTMADYSNLYITSNKEVNGQFGCIYVNKLMFFGTVLDELMKNIA